MGPKGEKKVKRKHNKDPLRPKRPTSAYFYFAKKCREDLASEGKRIHKVGDFTKEVSLKWKSLADRTVFEAEAKKDKERFDAEMAAYKGSKGPKKKRAATAYFHFLADFRKRPECAKLHIKDISSQAGAAWRGLHDDDKKPYIEKYEKQRKDIQEEEARAMAAAGASAAGASGAAAAAPAAALAAGALAADNGVEEDDEDFDDEDDFDEEDDE